MNAAVRPSLKAVQNWANKRLTSARIARNKSTSIPARAMLAGKVKAFTEVICFINDRYGYYDGPKR